MLLFIFTILTACTAFAGVEPYRNMLSGKIRQGDSLIVKDEKFRNPAVVWADITNRSVNNQLVLRLLNDSSSVFKKKFSCELDLKVEYYANIEQAEPIEINNVRLKVDYKPGGVAGWRQEDIYRFTNGYWVKVTVNSITSPELGDSIPSVLELTSQITIDRKYRYNETQPLHIFGTLDQGNAGVMQRYVGGQLDEGKNYLHLTWTAVDGADEYDIEWAVFDGDAEFESQLAQMVAGQCSNCGEEALDNLFRNNATRITTTAMQYDITMAYNEKYIVVRMRGIDYPDGGYRIEHEWRYTNNTNQYAIWEIGAWHQPTLNWQYSGTFAEEGKKKEVMSYFDGSLRNRQTVTLNNDKKIAMIQETIYDVFGRPAANILPAPHPDNKLKYYGNFNVYGTSNKGYNFKNINGTEYSICEYMPDALNTSKGAAAYYSAANPFLGSAALGATNGREQILHKYIPDAEGYPFSVTTYENDNTGRIRMQGGVGPLFQPGKTLIDVNDPNQTGNPRSAVTRYYYGRPYDWELNRLFGNDVGYAKHYLKNMVMDANGQLSITYVNAAGKTIATAMAGDNPKNLKSLESKPEEAEQVQEILTPTEFVFDSRNLSIVGSAPFLATQPDQEVKLEYGFDQLIERYQSNTFQICSNCYYTLSVKISDDCGETVYQSASNSIVGSELSDCNKTQRLQNTVEGVHFAPGKYYITFELKLDKDVINRYTDEYISQNADLRTRFNFVLDYLNSTDFSTCFDECTTCKASLGAKEQFFQVFKEKVGEFDMKFEDLALADQQSLQSLAYTRYDALLADCLSKQATCVTDVCSVYEKLMLQDVSPGGQFALFQSSPFLALENNVNILAQQFRNEFPVLPPGATQYEAEAFYLEDGKTKTSPHDASFTLQMLVKYWKASWAQRFLNYHPEKCKLDFCISNSQYISWDEQVKININKASEIASIPATTGLSYNPNDATWLLAQDPFFKAGAPGATYYTQISTDLQEYSHRVMSQPGSLWPAKSLTAMVDYILYCADPAGNTNGAPSGDSWVNCWPNQDCRVPDREWLLYREYYFQLKERYYNLARNEGACAGKCQVGTPVGVTGCAAVSDFTIQENGNNNGASRELKISYAKGTALRQMVVELYYPAEYASAGIVASHTFNVGESEKTLAVPAGMPINALRIKNIVCNGNIPAPACLGRSGTLDIGVNGVTKGQGQYELTSQGILYSYTIIQGTLTQPPSEASYCAGGVFASKEFYNCYRVTLPNGSYSDYSNVWVINCTRDLCTDAPVHQMSYTIKANSFYNAVDGKNYAVVLRSGNVTPLPFFCPIFTEPDYKPCLKVQVSGQPVQTYFDAALISCEPCMVTLEITPVADLGNNRWRMSDNTSRWIFPHTAENYQPSTDNCFSAVRSWHPCLSVTINGNTQNFINATMLTCGEEPSPCDNAPTFEMVNKFTETHFVAFEDNAYVDYYIIQSSQQNPPSNNYCGTTPEFYPCLNIWVQDHSTTQYTDVWVIKCGLGARSAPGGVVAADAVNTLPANNTSVTKLIYGYAAGEKMVPFLVKAVDTTQKQALNSAPLARKGYEAFRFYKRITIQRSATTSETFRNVWVAPVVETGSTAVTAAAKAIASSSVYGFPETPYDPNLCREPFPQFYVEKWQTCQNGDQGLMVTLASQFGMCPDQSYTVHVYVTNGTTTYQVGTVAFMGPLFSPQILCVPPVLQFDNVPMVACVGGPIAPCNPPGGTCPDFYKYKESRFPQFNYNLSFSLQDATNLQNEQQAMIQQQVNASCVSMADSWIDRLAECLNAIPEPERTTKINALKAALIDVCKRGGDLEHPSGASTTRPGDPNPSSFKAVIKSVLQLSNLTMTCNPWLIESPQPYEPKQQAISKELVNSNPAICGKLQQLHSRHQNEAAGISFYQFLKNTYGAAMNLTTGQLAILEKSCNNCRYMVEEPMLLPVFLEPGTVGCINKAEFDAAKTALETEFGASWNTSHANYEDIFSNFMNQRFGFLMPFSRYEEYQATVNANNQAILCNEPPFTSVDQDPYACLKSLVRAAALKGSIEYDKYIVEERRKFALRYVEKCSQLNGLAKMKTKQQQYHFTLYYYDQAGNLIRTISPEGVRPLSLSEIDIVNKWREFDPATCTGEGMPSVSDPAASLTKLSDGLYTGSTKTVEMWLNANPADFNRKVRLITPDNRYLFQAAVTDNKLWVELYTLQPSPVRVNRAVADITSVNMQAWSHLVITASNMVSGTWDIYFEGKKLTLMTSGQPAFPFDITPGANLPAADLSYLKLLRMYTQTADQAAVTQNFSNSCMLPGSLLTGQVGHTGRFNVPQVCNPATETRVVANQGALQVTDNLAMNTSRFEHVMDNFTIEFWANPNQAHEIDQVYDGTAGTATMGISGQRFAIYPTNMGAGIGASVGVSVGTNGVSVYEHDAGYMPATLVWQGIINQWTHIAVVYEERIPFLYINGELKAQGIQSPMTYVCPGSNICSGPYGVMTGGIDEVRIWKVSRTTAQIQENYRSGISPTSNTLAAYWPLTAHVGTTFQDLTCNGQALYPAAGAYSWNTTAMPATVKDIVPVEYAARSYYPAHRLLTSYAFNSTGQVVRQKSPDGGDSYFWYDRLSRLIGSQNEEQRLGAGSAKYSYTVYEAATGRIKEVGEKSNAANALPATPGFVDNVAVSSFLTAGTNKFVTQTFYDERPSGIAGMQTTLMQNNLRKRVSAVLYKEDGTAITNASYYDYDLIGNVKTLWQDIGGLGLQEIKYEYDLQSGKVNLVRYKQGQPDQFIYKYDYDAENRLTRASSGTLLGSNIKRDASYYYYLHGPLGRAELGDVNQMVQGLDYTYTLQGWLKGVNGDKLNPSAEIGGDGIGGNNTVAKDVLAFSLGYYKGDYKPIVAGTNAFTLKYGAAANDLTGKNLFNGNISHTTLAISRFKNGDPVGYSYGYDQLNRLVEMRQHILTGTTTNWTSASITDAYKECIKYDGNGNILSYLRNGANTAEKPLAMDNLTYRYNRPTDPVSGQDYLVNNRLQRVTDAVPSENYTEDIDTQNSDYVYDRIGNLIQENGDQIFWTVYGKIDRITKSNGDEIKYSYDPAGNRVKKFTKLTVEGQSGKVETTTWYVRDAQGNVLGVYTQKGSGPKKWQEQHLYGSSRIGMWSPNMELSTGNAVNEWGIAGKKSYELTNHLGNVLAVVSDVVTTQPDNSLVATLKTAHDYYPFGMQMPERTFEAACREVVQSMTEEVANSDLTTGVTQSGTEYWHNGVRWQRLNNATIVYENGAMKCNNGGTSSDGIAAYIPAAGVAPNTTYVMEFDIVDKSANITYFNCQAHSPGNDVYRVMTRKTGLGHHSFVFTTPAVMPQYIRLRITSNLISVGTYFSVDNFICRKYNPTGGVEYPLVASANFDDGVMDGVNVVSNGMTFRPLQPQYSTISLTGTTDKKITVNCTNVNESYLMTEIDVVGGEQYLLKFNMTQALADKRMGMRVFARTNGVWELSEAQGMFYVGSGNNVFNFKCPVGADRVRIEMYRANSGQTWDGYNVPYTIDNYSLSRLILKPTISTILCDPGADPSGLDGIYRYGFNGKENDNDVKGSGNQQDYGMRIYDPRLGRFFSVDPITKGYPELTPYQFASNSPVSGIDLDGLEYVTAIYSVTIFKGVQKVTASYVWHNTLTHSEYGALGMGVKYEVNIHDFDDNKFRTSSYFVSRGGGTSFGSYVTHYGNYMGSDGLPNFNVYHGNPIPGTYRYDVPAIDYVDEQAKMHDIGYDRVGAVGATGLFEDFATTPYDEAALRGWRNYLDNYKAGVSVDPVNKELVRKQARDAAWRGHTLFESVVSNKIRMISDFMNNNFENEALFSHSMKYGKVSNEEQRQHNYQLFLKKYMDKDADGNWIRKVGMWEGDSKKGYTPIVKRNNE